MEISKIKSILRQMSVGETWDEKHFLRQEMTVTELNCLVSKGYLLKDKKNANDFLSDNKYTLTEKGKKFAWEEEINNE